MADAGDVRKYVLTYARKYDMTPAKMYALLTLALQTWWADMTPSGRAAHISTWFGTNEGSDDEKRLINEQEIMLADYKTWTAVSRSIKNKLNEPVSNDVQTDTSDVRRWCFDHAYVYGMTPAVLYALLMLALETWWVKLPPDSRTVMVTGLCDTNVDSREVTRLLTMQAYALIDFRDEKLRALNERWDELEKNEDELYNRKDGLMSKDGYEILLAEAKDRRTEEVNGLLDVLEDVVQQACLDDTGKLDSMALSAYAKAMRILAKHGRLDIEVEVGRRVIGTWSTSDD